MKPAAWREADTIRMDFPSEPVTATEAPVAFAEALDVPFTFAGKNRMDWLVEVADEAEVKAVRPDLRALMTLGVRGGTVAGDRVVLGGRAVTVLRAKLL